jgi:hypothetical protein
MSRRDTFSAGVFDFSNAAAFEVFEDQTNTNTISEFPNYITKLSGSTSEISSGRYVINWSFEIANSTNNNSSWSRVQWKKSVDSTYITLTEIDNFIGRSDKYVPVSGFKVVDVDTEDTIDFRIEFCRSGGTARIQNVNIYIFRVAV